MVLKWLEKKAFATGLASKDFFRKFVRRPAYALAGGDPEKVHEMALEALNEYWDVIEDFSPRFYEEALEIKINGKSVMPFGTAAGLDKNADAVRPLSYLLGFQEVGTIIVNPRDGNARPRVAVDEENGDLYNAQGFPSKGLKHAKQKLQDYRESGGKGVILASICGIPPEPDRLDVAYNETQQILAELDSLVDGFVWNPFSPNTVALTALRTPETFEKYANLVKRTADKRLALVKMGPYDDEPEKRGQWLGLARGWMVGGGDGIVAVNTYMVPKEKVPSNSWGYQSAGRSGRFLQNYRQRAVEEARREFPDAFIIATGGIDSGEEAWKTVKSGADALEGYTPYTFHGFALLLDIAEGLKYHLKASGKSLSEFQKSIRTYQL